jgi:hypothetical protein
MSGIPCMGPEGIEYVSPKGGFNLALNTRDQIRWTNIFQNLKQKGWSAEKAEIQAFLQVYAMKDLHLKY